MATFLDIPIVQKFRWLLPPTYEDIKKHPISGSLDLALFVLPVGKVAKGAKVGLVSIAGKGAEHYAGKAVGAIKSVGKGAAHWARALFHKAPLAAPIGLGAGAGLYAAFSSVGKSEGKAIQTKAEASALEGTTTVQNTARIAIYVAGVVGIAAVAAQLLKK